jgi:hypothetical protein
VEILTYARVSSSILGLGIFVVLARVLFFFHQPENVSHGIYQVFVATPIGQPQEPSPDSPALLLRVRDPDQSLESGLGTAELVHERVLDQRRRLGIQSRSRLWKCSISSAYIDARQTDTKLFTIQQDNTRRIKAQRNGQHYPLGLPAAQRCPVPIPQLRVDAPAFGDVDRVRLRVWDAHALLAAGLVPLE